MRMKNAWLPALIFCATLALVAASLDLGPIIKIAQCRSTCLRHHMIDGKCLTKIGHKMNDCAKCWDICKTLISLETEERHNVCVQRSYQDYQGHETACKFYRTHGIEDDKYEPTKLPAPEEDETIYMNDYDIAVLMQKNLQGIWKEENYYRAQEQPTLKPGDWIIIITDDGVVKHYSWEKWRPKLELLKAGGPLYQAYITWQDWRIQLKAQRERIASKIFKAIFTFPVRVQEPSFVVTWQQEAGDGIMGNQVTDSESAQISLSCGKYLVRVATNNGPGSYPIIVDTGICEIPKISIWNLNAYVNDPRILKFIVFSMGVLSGFIITLCVCEKARRKNAKESEMEEGRLTKAEKRLTKKESLTKMKKKLMNQDVLRLCTNTHSNLLRVEGMDMKVNASVSTQDANNSTQNVKCENENVIQKS